MPTGIKRGVLMITVFPVLRQYMRTHGITNRELAAVLGVSKAVLQLKMWGIKRWTLTDAVRICGFFSCPDVEHLFVRNYNKQQFLESQEENGNV
jgi:DNA-binding XRE family transcriptional regulator